MMIRVRLFAVARQVAGREEVELEVPEPATVAQVREHLARAVPALGNLADRFLFAVNSEYADDTTTIPSAAEVACIPPVSGG